MAFRTCTKCGAANNPLSRLNFRKSRMDGRVYCENCLPDGPNSEEPDVPAPSAPSVKPSAGYVVIDCPDCAGGTHRPHAKPCLACAGYGAVRIETNMLNVYRRLPIKAPEVLTES